MRLIFILVLLSFSTGYVYSQVKLELNSGEIVEGYLISNNDSVMVLSLFDKTIRHIPKRSIESDEELTTTVILNDGTDFDIHIEKMDSGRIYFHNPYNMYMTIDRAEIRSMELEKHDISRYMSVGATVLGPSYFNLVLGFQSEPNVCFKFFVSTDLIERYYIHMDLGYCLYKSKSIEYNILLGGAIGRDIGMGYNSSDDTYWGIFADANFGGIFFETGLLLYRASIYEPRFIFGIGYVYRFID